MTANSPEVRVAKMSNPLSIRMRRAAAAVLPVSPSRRGRANNINVRVHAERIRRTPAFSTQLRLFGPDRDDRKIADASESDVTGLQTYRARMEPMAALPVERARALRSIR